MKIKNSELRNLIKEELAAILRDRLEVKVLEATLSSRVEFLLSLDGERIGYLKAEKLYDDRDREVPETYYVDNVYVGENPESAFRRKGYGTHLYKYAIKWLFINKGSRLVPGEYLGSQVPGFDPKPEEYTGTSPSARKVWKRLKDSGFIDDEFYWKAKNEL